MLSSSVVVLFISGRNLIPLVFYLYHNPVHPQISQTYPTYIMDLYTQMHIQSHSLT
jgi:hypothetical protein